MKNLLTLLFLFLFSHSFSQDFSNKGKDFWVAYPGHTDGLDSRMALYLTSDVNATGTVTVNGSVIAFTVTANQVTTVQFTSSTNPSNAIVYNDQVEGKGNNKGIHIVSDKPIVVYSHILHSARSGSTLVLPTEVLGKEYFASSYTNTGRNNDKSEFDVVATVDNTVVEITPTVPDANGTHVPNVPYTVTLNKGDVYQYQSDDDVSGTHIKSIGTGTISCQPIAVFSGSTRTYMGCSNPTSGDNLYQQLFPFASWGLLYYTAPFINRAYDVFRVFVQDPATVVTVDGVALNPATIINGRFYEFTTEGNNKAKIISANKPVCVFQYMISENCDNYDSDPEMIILNSVDQTLNDITVMSARKDLTPPNTNIENHYLNIIFKNSSFGSLKIDGLSPGAQPIAIPGTGYSYVQEDVTASTNIRPSHHITSDSGFICIAYGTGHIESYGYNAGTNIRDKYQYITLTNINAAVNFPATCRLTPFYFSITLPYKPSSLYWDFFNNPGLSPNAPVTNNSPVPDSSFIVDGKTLYVYKLPVIYRYASTGVFPLKVTAQNPTPEGCSGTQEISYDVNVYEKPVVEFTYPAAICLGDSVHFTDVTNGSGRPVIRWSWDLGNGSTTNVKNPVAAYNAAGNYNVKLQAITDIGCVSDTTKVVSITSLPVANFSFTSPACIANAVIFTDASTVAVGTLVKRTWMFGDGSPAVVSGGNSPITHTYDLARSYTVVLIAETAAGCRDSVSKTITIQPKPVADFIVPKVCLNDDFASFVDSSYMPSGAPSNFTYRWSFGDANATPANPDTSAQRNPTHRYTATGTYTASLTVTTAAGCSSTIAKTFTVNGSYPVASFSILDSGRLCTNKAVVIQNNSSVFPGSITKVSIDWESGAAGSTSILDNNPYPGKTYSNQYPLLPTSTSYTIRLKAYSGQTCVNTATKTVSVNPSPHVTFSPIPDICYNDTPRTLVQVKETTNIPGSGAFSGIGVAGVGVFNPQGLAGGEYNILFTYTTTAGCIDTASQTIRVNKVTVDAGADQIVFENNPVTLHPVVTGEELIYKWQPSTYLDNAGIEYPVSTPKDDITYQLSVTGKGGCSAADTVRFTVLKEPIVPNAFSPNGDGINDVWNIRFFNSYPGAVVEVYNRYGMLVYRSFGYHHPWDGTYNGITLPTGVYYYIIEPKSGRKEMVGWVTILR